MAESTDRPDRRTPVQPSDLPEPAGVATGPDPAARFRQLPERVRPDQMVEERPASDPNDPEFGRNPDRDWMLRYSS